jgi:hypothetical protein
MISIRSSSSGSIDGRPGATVSFVSAQDYTPKRTDDDFVRDSDIPWLARFAADGGKIVISGDVSMRADPFERAALVDNGFVTIFFEKSWSDWNFFRKSALLLHWWPQVAKRIKIAKPGEFWCIPSAWIDGELRRIEPMTATIEKRPPAQIDKTSEIPGRKRRSRHPNGGQGTLDV